MQVRVDEERCQGHGLCRLSAPDIFFAALNDGHTTLMTAVAGSVPNDGSPLYCHVYCNWTTPNAKAALSTPGYVYTLTIGPLAQEVIYYYDVSDILLAYKGQWITGGDNTPPVTPTNTWDLSAYVYCSNQFGLVYEGTVAQPTFLYAGIGGQSQLIGPPYPLSPIYHRPPWPQ